MFRARVVHLGPANVIGTGQVTVSVEVSALKSDSFGRIALMRGEHGLFVRRDLVHVPLWLRLPAWWLARREARALQAVVGLDAVPQLLAWNGRRLDRSYMDGAAMYQRPPRGDLVYFREARRLLQRLHRHGIAHNDLAKEANWLVQADGSPGIIDFQLAVRGNPRSRWMRLLAREDLRHLLKHKRTYCPAAITPVERRVLKRHSWLREVWFATGKPVYRFVTRRLLKWEDNEGQGPKP
ncbi:serine/threonine protein kinase [Lysobacter alkalisoli]|uniref:Serine/threonine protein kinase n=1 Tax=Marilutibacter alkalisoli TaxID=2591633 RepID=A0A514BP18_9GAMM|nr:serine/threonine protein kinase [Lysobacter alkalisoli]